jgi:hypothetical protein
VDPISLIVAALVAGASSAARDTAGEAVRDAYAGLKSLLRRRFGGDEPKGLDAPSEHEESLKERLRQAGAAGDEELVRAAQEVMKHADPEGTRAGKYTVTITGGQGIVVGDKNTTTMNFGGE